MYILRFASGTSSMLAFSYVLPPPPLMTTVIALLPEAIEFIEKMEPTTRENILYNMAKVQMNKDPSLLKKLDDHIWEYRTL